MAFLKSSTGDSGVYDAWEPADMEMLRNSLYTIKGKWLLSCDGSDICREIFSDFAKVEVPFKYSAGTGDRIRPEKSEMLVACGALFAVNNAEKIIVNAKSGQATS